MINGTFNSPVTFWDHLDSVYSVIIMVLTSLDGNESTKKKICKDKLKNI